MQKSVADLNATELSEAAAESWKVAAQKAFAAGLPVTGTRDGRRIRYFPDGHIEDLGPVAEISKDDANLSSKKTGRSAS